MMMTTSVSLRRGLVLMTLVAGAACAKTLPDQDRRIVSAVPVVKTTSEFFWKEYQDDVEAGNRKYWGQAVEISGRVASVSKDGPSPFLMFEQKEGPGGVGVRANLLDDQAADILASAVVGQRLRLKCYCAGISGALVLKSCVKP